MFPNVRVVLVSPSHPGNIGAVARAMKTMGLTRLYLVTPEKFPHVQATAMAAGSDDILANARLCGSLVSALEGCQLVYASSARTRKLTWSQCNPRECAEQIIQLPQLEIALVFGREASGLTNEELAYCHRQVIIPAVIDYSSLNLAAAVQVLAYELHMVGIQRLTPVVERPNLASAEQMEGFFQHLQTTLVELDCFDPKQPKMLMRRLRRLYNRAQPDVVEINILRGILSGIHKKIK